jgi:hypothetical protein
LLNAAVLHLPVESGIYKSTIDDKIIIERESWWKDVLNSREYGYNEN